MKHYVWGPQAMIGAACHSRIAIAMDAGGGNIVWTWDVKAALVGLLLITLALLGQIVYALACLPKGYLRAWLRWFWDPQQNEHPDYTAEREEMRRQTVRKDWTLN